MPHKHKRKGVNDDSYYDLPPTKVARSLPVGKDAQPTKPDKHNKRRKPIIPKVKDKSNYGKDDTPKAFARAMARINGKTRSGLDDGEKKSKKRKRNDAEKNEGATEKDTKPKVTSQDENKNNEGGADEDGDGQAVAPAADEKKPLTIQPGESMRDFSARVDRELPLSGLTRKGKKIEGMREGRMTKHEKRLRRLQAGWREEEVRIKEKEEERREEEQEAEEELMDQFEDKNIELPITGKKKKGKGGGGQDDDWAVLKKRREAPNGLHDVVQAPPEFTRIPKEKFKIKNGAKVDVENVPNNAGSLRKREELGETRQSIIANYRKMMEGKRGEQTQKA